MIVNEPALLELFNRLRQAGMPLGLEEYFLLLQALDAGFGTEDRNALAQLCSTLWVKSEEEQLIFQNYFEQLILKETQQQNLPSTTELTEFQVSILDNSKADNVNIKKQKYIRVIRCIFWGVISSLVTAMFILLLLPKNSKNYGILSFKTIPFSNSLGNIQENEKNPKIRIARTGGSRGKVSATIIIDETNDYYRGKLFNYWLNCGKSLTNVSSCQEFRESLNDFKRTSISVTFADGESGVKEVPLPIFDDKIFEGNETITLQLTNPKGEVKIRGKDTGTLTINDAEDILEGSEVEQFGAWLEVCLIIIGILLILLITVRMRSMRKKIIASDDKDTKALTNLPIAKLPPQVIQTIFDEIQIAKAIKQSDSQLGETFPIIPKDIPVTYRQMKQGWRYLRHLIREGVPTELDIEKTIAQIEQQGFLLNPVLKPRRINKIELLLLMDQDGSMVPFHHLSQALIKTASRDGRFNQVRVYYFHNCPIDYLYKDPYQLEAVPIEDCLSQLRKKRVVCLIFSDAGAARGQFSSKRRRRTKFFLKELKQYVHHIVWLNPFPRERWKSSSAAEIARLVSMFEVNRQELYQAIETLRGREQKLGKLIRQYEPN